MGYSYRRLIPEGGLRFGEWLYRDQQDLPEEITRPENRWIWGRFPLSDEEKRGYYEVLGDLSWSSTIFGFHSGKLPDILIILMRQEKPLPGLDNENGCIIASLPYVGTITRRCYAIGTAHVHGLLRDLGFSKLASIKITDKSTQETKCLRTGFTGLLSLYTERVIYDFSEFGISVQYIDLLKLPTDINRLTAYVGNVEDSLVSVD